MRRGTFKWQGLLDAPVILLPFADPKAYVDRYGEPDKVATGLGVGPDAWPVPYWTVDASMSVMTLLLAAEDEGLGALFFGVFRGERELRRTLGVPPALQLLGAISLGARPARAEPAPATDAPAEPAPSGAESASPAPALPTLSVASPARASSEPDQAMSERPPRYDLIRLNVGLRVGYIPNRAFDTFASSDVLSQLSIDGTYPLLTKGKVVLGVGLGWNVGGRSDTVRGFESSVTAHRLSVPIEGRYHVKPWLYGFGKLAPGAAVMSASVKDGALPGGLSATGWAFSADASVGASILLGSHKHLDRRALRLWATPEIGYAYTTDAPLRASAGRDDKDVLGSDESTSLRALALSGLFWRASIGATF
jgi:hypothetical protein